MALFSFTVALQMNSTDFGSGLFLNLNSDQKLILGQPHNRAKFVLEHAPNPNENEYYIRSAATQKYLTVDQTNQLSVSAASPTDSSLFYMDPLIDNGDGVKFAVICHNQMRLQAPNGSDVEMVVQATGEFSDDPNCQLSIVSLVDWQQ